MKSSTFSLVVLITIFFTRFWAMSFFYFFGEGNQVSQSVVNDSLHHYHLGLILIVIGFLLRKKKNSLLIAAVGLGIFLEEWAVFFSDLGLQTNQLYLTKIDFFAIVAVVGIFYIVSRSRERTHN